MLELRGTNEALPRGGTLSDAVKVIRSALGSSAESDRRRVEMLDFVADHDDALLRTCAAGHLTASALVLDSAKERVLLMLHAKLAMWLQPGGHADGEGHLATVALKEATEETGIVGLALAQPAVDCDVHMIGARPGEPEHLHFDVRYVVIAPPDATAVGNHESRELRWVSPEELDRLATDDSLSRLARVGLDYARAL